MGVTYFTWSLLIKQAITSFLRGGCFPGGTSGKESICQWGDVGEVGSIPGLGRSPGEGHGNPPQYSCLENPMDRGAWRAKVCGVTKSQTQLKWLSTHAHLFCQEACRILVLQPGIKSVPPILGAGSLNHWTTREMPKFAWLLLCSNYYPSFVSFFYCSCFVFFFFLVY